MVRLKTILRLVPQSEFPQANQELQNTVQKPHHHHRGFSVLLTFILRDFREPSRKACPPNKEREKKNQTIMYFLRISIPEPH